MPTLDDSSLLRLWHHDCFWKSAPLTLCPQCKTERLARNAAHGLALCADDGTGRLTLTKPLPHRVKVAMARERTHNIMIYVVSIVVLLGMIGVTYLVNTYISEAEKEARTLLHLHGEGCAREAYRRADSLNTTQSRAAVYWREVAYYCVELQERK